MEQQIVLKISTDLQDSSIKQPYSVTRAGSNFTILLLQSKGVTFKGLISVCSETEFSKVL